MCSADHDGLCFYCGVAVDEVLCDVCGVSVPNGEMFKCDWPRPSSCLLARLSGLYCMICVGPLCLAEFCFLS